MANLVRSRSAGQVKPIAGSMIDWGHPLANGLISCWLLNENAGRPEDIASGQPTLVSGTASTAVPGGWAKWITGGIRFSDAFNSNEMWTSKLPRTDGTNEPIPLTIQVRGRISAATHGAWYGTGTTTSGTEGFQLGVGNSSFSTNGSNIMLMDAGVNIFALTAFPIGPWVDLTAIAYATTGANSYRVWLGSVEVGAGNLSGMTTTFTNSVLGGGKTTANGDIAHCRAWNRALSRDEIAWLAAEPYAFIAPPGPKIFYIDLGVSGPATVTGSAAITGTGTVSASGVRTRSGAAAISGSGTLVGAGVRTRIATATISGSGVVSATGLRKALGSVAITGTGTISATGPASTDLSAERVVAYAAQSRVSATAAQSRVTAREQP